MKDIEFAWRHKLINLKQYFEAEFWTIFFLLQVISLELPAKYKPIKDLSIGGIVMMKKLSDEPEELVKPVEIKKNHVETEEEPQPPEAFEYTD